MTRTRSDPTAESTLRDRQLAHVVLFFAFQSLVFKPQMNFCDHGAQQRDVSMLNRLKLAEKLPCICWGEIVRRYLNYLLITN